MSKMWGLWSAAILAALMAACAPGEATDDREQKPSSATDTAYGSLVVSSITALPISPTDVNNYGVVVGTDLSSGVGKIWDNGTITSLTSFSPMAVNDNGVVVGTATVGGVTGAAVWKAGATTILDSSYNAVARDINNSEQIVGWSYAYTSTNDPVLWQGGTGVTLTPGSLTHDQAYAISPGGIVVGKYQNSSAGNEAGGYFSGAWSSLNLSAGVSPGSRFGLTSSVNSKGEMAGSFNASGSINQIAFLYRGGAISQLWSNNWTNEGAVYVNDNSQVVGTWLAPDLSSSSGKFWEKGVLTDLNAVPSISGAGWTITSATSINNRGQIVGVGLLSGVSKGFLLEIGKTSSTTKSYDLVAHKSDVSASIPTEAICRGMCEPNIHLGSASLSLVDTPVGYAPQKGPPLFIRLNYGHRDVGAPANPPFFNVGPNWTLNVLSYVEDDPASAGTRVQRYAAGGGVVDYATEAGAFVSGSFGAEKQTGAVLKRINTAGVISYELTFPDGAQQIFAKSDGAASYPRRLFLTQIKDPDGNAVTFTYDATQLRLNSIADAAGRSTSFCYNSSGSSCTSGTDKKVYRITDPFGNYASLAYDGAGRLAGITDVQGLTSSFTYDANDPTLIASLKTPYGTSSFSAGYDLTSFYNWVQITDPLGFTERAEFWTGAAPGVPASETIPSGITAVNGVYNKNNTFYWNKVSYPSYGTGSGKDYTKASISHWLLNSTGGTAGIPESTKEPLDSRIFYNYTGQPSGDVLGSFWKPTKIGRILPGGGTQLKKFAYNAVGNVLNAWDAYRVSGNGSNGRELRYSYAANGIDLLTVEQRVATGTPGTWKTWATYGSYTAGHKPQSYTDGNSNATAYAYNGAGQLTQVTEPGPRVTKFDYDGFGRQTTTRRTVGMTDVTLLTKAYGTYPGTCGSATNWKNCDLPKTVTDSTAPDPSTLVNRVVSYEYDELDHITKITYPDTTTELFSYAITAPEQAAMAAGAYNAASRILDLRKYTDRLGRVTTYNYNANRWLNDKIEPYGSGSTRQTFFAYYQDGSLNYFTDANSVITSWDIDIQGRTTGKNVASGFGGYGQSYDSAGRPLTKTDSYFQSKTFAYNADDTVASISYGNPHYSVGTPTISYAYDDWYPRLSFMSDATGATYFGYIDPQDGRNGTGKLLWEDGPTAGDGLVYTYDSLGRMVSRTVEETGGDKTETWAYDIYDRVRGCP